MITIEPTYVTVTEGFDWGPAITKVVLDFGRPVDNASLSSENFQATAVRHYRAYDYAISHMEKAARDHTSVRTVIAVYAADVSGNPTPAGAYVAVELLVEADMVEANPLHYDAMGTARNTFIDTHYIITATTPIVAKDGTLITMLPTTKKGKTGDNLGVADDFIHDQPFSHGDIDLLYASFAPKKASTQQGSNPLIIWLHGAGEGGADTRLTLLGNKVTNLAKPVIQQHFGNTGSYVLVPQCLTRWMDYDGTNICNSDVPYSDGQCYYTEALFALIENFISENPTIDRNRIYIGGCSNGGYMAVHMIIEYPNYFAAAYPVCHGYSVDWMTDKRIDTIIDTPIWMTHALTDSILPIAEGTQGENPTEYTVSLDAQGEPILLDDNSNALYNRLIAKGADNVHYSCFDKVVDTSGKFFQADGVTPYEYFGHMSWAYTLNNECVEIIDGVETSLFAWLAKQSRQER